MADNSVQKPVETAKKPCCSHQSKPCKATELPIYGNPHPTKDVIIIDKPGYIESAIRTSRVAVTQNLSFLEGSIDRTKEIVATGVEHSKATYGYLTEEGNDAAKAGAIVGGGLMGLLLASRRGFFKKFIYTSLGTGAVAAACYPKKAVEYSEVAGYILQNKAPGAVKEYTGVDIEEYLKYFKKSKREDAKEKAKLAAVVIPQDRDQSKPQDSDLYSNRNTR